MGEKTSKHNGVEGNDNRFNTSDSTDAKLRRIVRALARQLAREHHEESCKRTKSDPDSER